MSSRDGKRPDGVAVVAVPAGSHQTAVSRDGRLMDSSPRVTFLRPIGAAKIPRACRKPSRYLNYRARLMGLGDRIDVFFHAFSDVYSRLGGGDFNRDFRAERGDGRSLWRSVEGTRAMGATI